MNRVVRFSLACIAGLFLFACSKEKSVEKNSGGSNSAVTGVLRMKIDGQQWVADDAAGATIESGVIGLYGLGKDKKQFVITLLGTGTGTYKLDQSSLNAAALTEGNDATQFAFVSNQGTAATAGGEVIVTKIDNTKKTISGTFQVKVFRDADNKGKVLTEGVFEDLSFAPVTPGTGNPGTGNPGTGNPGTGNPGGGTTGNSLSAKINGADFKPTIIAGVNALGLLSIVGTDATSKKSIGFQLPATIAVGEYAFTGLGGTYTGQYNASESQVLLAESGKLKITEHNTSTKKIVGTFEFQAKEFGGTVTATITAGSFSITYQ